MSLHMTDNLKGYGKSVHFNMTPIVDIVFLLIVFFLVVCQFIEAENFVVSVPDDCSFADSRDDRKVRSATVTVMQADDGAVDFAVGSEKVLMVGSSGTDRIAELIDIQLSDLPAEEKTVTLRIDKNICFEQAQYAIAAIAQSTATNIKIAALKEKRNDLHQNF